MAIESYDEEEFNNKSRAETRRKLPEFSPLDRPPVDYSTPVWVEKLTPLFNRVTEFLSVDRKEYIRKTRAVLPDEGDGKIKYDVQVAVRTTSSCPRWLKAGGIVALLADVGILYWLLNTWTPEQLTQIADTLSRLNPPF